MFHRFSTSARSIVSRARDITQSESRNLIEPEDILLALTELHAALFERASEQPIDVKAIQSELAQSKTSVATSSQGGKLKVSKECKQVLMLGYDQARSCWKQWEAPRRKRNRVLPEDLEYWEARMKQPLRKRRFSGRFGSWLFPRRPWEVDERHLLLGLLEGSRSPGVAVLARQGLTLEAARQRLCATVQNADLNDVANKFP